MLRVPRHDRQGAGGTGKPKTGQLTHLINFRITVLVESCGACRRSGGRLMIPQSASLRWLAVAVYSAALLGALLVPHAHHAGGDCCSHGGGQIEHDHATVERVGASACRHLHHPTTGRHTCRHHHHSPAAPKASEPASTPSSPPAAPFDAECVLCRFLAQPVQPASPPLLLIGEALTPTLPDAVAVLAEPAALSTPPVRGPPLG